MVTTGYRIASMSGADDAKSDYAHSGGRQCFYTQSTWWMLAQDDSANDWFLWEWDGTTPASAGDAGSWAKAARTGGGTVNVDTRGSTLFDVVWEEAQQRLHVLGVNGTASRYNIWTYVSGADTWTNTLADKAISPNIGSNADHASICLDSSRRLWLVYYVQTTLTLECLWLDTTVAAGSMAFTQGPTLEAVGSLSDGASGLDTWAWSNQGTPHVGVAYGYNDGVSAGDGAWKFQYRPDSAATDAQWSAETILDESDIDDHVSLCGAAVGSQGDTLYLLAKNHSNAVVFFQRPPGGPWSAKTTVWTSGETTSRPKGILDVTNNVYYAFSGPGGGGVTTQARTAYKSTPTSAISFSAAVAALQLVNGTNGDMKSCGLPAHNVTQATGLLVMAGGPAIGADVACTWWNVLPILGAAPMAQSQKRRRALLGAG